MLKRYLGTLTDLTMVLGRYSYIDIYPENNTTGPPDIKLQLDVALGKELVKHALNKEKGNGYIKFEWMGAPSSFPC